MATRDPETRPAVFDGIGHPFLDETADATTRAVVGDPDPPPQAGHPGFLALLDEVRSLHVKKAADYGRGVDPLANVRASAEFGIPAWVGAVLRANDKIHRIKSFLANGSLRNEPLEDSLLDAACYFLIALALFREERS